MVVGTKDIDFQELSRIIYSNRDLKVYVESLVPRIIHTEEIVNNQKYYVACLIRRSDMKFYSKSDICEDLLKDVKLTGDITTIVDWKDILDNLNIDDLFEYVFEEELRNVST